MVRLPAKIVAWSNDLGDARAKMEQRNFHSA